MDAPERAKGTPGGTSARQVRIASIILVLVGAALLALNIFMGGKVNVALPLVFMLLGGMFVILSLALRGRWLWSAALYIPAGLMLSLGLVFLINVLTQDWTAWAYAWLLPVACLGAGAALASRELYPRWGWLRAAQIAGWATAAAGLTFFAIFGAIAGGLFIQVTAALLIILGGLSLRWLKLDRLLRAPKANPLTGALDQSGLVEPLSARELEVLSLVDAGLSNPQIAERLTIAPSTVKTHINNIYGKLGAQTRLQAVRRARELGLLKP